MCVKRRLRILGDEWWNHGVQKKNFTMLSCAAKSGRAGGDTGGFRKRKKKKELIEKVDM